MPGTAAERQAQQRQRNKGSKVVTKELLTAVRDSRVYSEQLPNGGIRLTIDMHRGADAIFEGLATRIGNGCTVDDVRKLIISVKAERGEIEPRNPDADGRI